MMTRFNAFLSLIFLAVLFVVLVFINNQVLSRYRADLTENAIYSLSDGTKNVLKGLKDPITLYYFYSDSTTTGMTRLRNYAGRIKSLLQEYEQASNGKVRVQYIDPVPFSEEEDRASQFGLTGAAMGNLGETIYFGLAGTNLLDDQFIIPFFDANNEQFLEYDISKLIYQLSEPETMTVALVTDLPVAGGQDNVTGQSQGPMAFYQQLSQLYNVYIVNSREQALPDSTDVVMLVHPQGLNDNLLYAIDQFALGGGRVLAFVDPDYEGDARGAIGRGGANGSQLPLLKAWGIKADLSNVVLDAQLGLDVRDQDDTVVKHYGILGLTAKQLDRRDVTTANLDKINGASFGALERVSKTGLTMEPLMQSSTNAGLSNANDYSLTADPLALQRGFGGNTVHYVLAARYSGKARSYFSQPAAAGLADSYISQTDNLNVILVADVDMLSDRYWVQQATFFGENLFTPFANNGDFIVNCVENLTGSNALISIRARSTFARPFVKVKELESHAEQQYRKQEQLLLDKLSAVESQLVDLKEQQGRGGNIVFSEQQQQDIDELLAKRMELRRQLREVRFQLDRDIDSLGNKLKLLNVVAAPVVLIVILLLLSMVLKRRAGKRYRKES